MKAGRFFPILLSLALILSACNLPSAQAVPTTDPQAVFTQAAETVVAELTKSALQQPPTQAPATLAPATLTPSLPTNTPQPLVALPTATLAPAAPAAVCDAAAFITDVSIADGTVFSAGSAFTKTWRLKNTGTCTWSTSYALVFDSGDQMGGAASLPLPASVAPGQTVDLSVNLQAPTADKTYRGYWGLQNASGARVPVQGGSNGRSFYVEIKVGTGGSGAAEATGKFAVTSVGFSVAHDGACSFAKYTITATVTANKAGDVTYTWKRSDNATSPSNSGTLTFDSAGSKTITFE